MKVKYIDTVCTNTQHIIFNASLLAMLGNFYSNITFYGEKNNMNEVLDVLAQNHTNSSSLRTKKLPLPIAFLFCIYI